MIDARAKTIREILSTGSDQYLIPFFQRHYSWTRREWDRLWEDVVDLLRDEGQSRHFMGPLVCTPTSHVPGEVTPYQLIDGQQRLTTITIALVAARAVADEHDLPELSEEIYEDFLVHKRKKGIARFKLVPRFGDRETLAVLVENGDSKKARRDSIIKAFRSFQKHITALVDASEEGAEETLRALMRCLTDRLALVAITIEDENPYNIFESLNGKGLPLEQADLIRNFIFMQVPIEEQEEFNKQVWQEFEDALSPPDVDAPLAPTQFYRNYLMREGRYSPKRLTFVEFKDQAARSGRSPHDIVGELHRFLAIQHKLFAPQTVGDKALSQALDHARRLDIQTAHPLLLCLLSKADSGEIDSEELLGCINDICSFVLRRSFCGESTRRYGQQFVAAIRSLGSEVRQSLQNYLLDQGWPDDEAFKRAIRVFPAYRREAAKVRLILEAVERRHGHKEPVELAALTIEHVMPQTIGGNADGRAWRAMLGEQWERVHREKQHTLGNLTLSGYNSELSNLRYEKKRELLLNSNLDLNRMFLDIESWGEPQIQSRSDALSDIIAEMWPRPAGGQAYVPSGGTLADGQEELLQAYWDGFARTLDESDCSLSVQRIQADTLVWMKAGRKAFWFGAELDLDEGRLGFGLSISGQRRLDYFKLLWNLVPDDVSDALCELPGVIANWEESLECDDNSMWVYRKIDGIDNRDSWQEQHEWLALAASKWERLLTPEIGNIRLRQLVDFEDSDETDVEADEVGDE